MLLMTYEKNLCVIPYGIITYKDNANLFATHIPFLFNNSSILIDLRDIGTDE